METTDDIRCESPTCDNPAFNLAPTGSFLCGNCIQDAVDHGEIDPEDM